MMNAMTKMAMITMATDSHVLLSSNLGMMMNKAWKISLYALQGLWILKTP